MNFFDSEFLKNCKGVDLFPFAVLNPQIALVTFLKLWKEMIAEPDKVKKIQLDLLDRLVELNKNFLNEYQDKEINLEYNQKNQKFEDLDFNQNPALRFVNQFHEVTSKWILDTMDEFHNIDPKLMHSARFFAKQYIDMMSPKNFPIFNGDFWKKTLATSGDNIQKGLQLLMEDFKKGTISTTDSEYFDVGGNLANTKGKIIFQNDIIELIQYSPTTPQVFEKPILFVPPWINKYYILDLNEEMSFVKWTVDHGFTVFMISWVNPDKRYKNKGFENYMIEGLLASIDRIYEITKVKSIHTIGYCVGGTLISCFLAYLANPLCKHRPESKIDSATFLTTLLDFTNAGDLAIFMADIYLKAISAQSQEQGFLDGKVMFNTFSTLKANDMIWRYVRNSYMLGEKPPAHEILFWNSDSTNITNAMEMFLACDLYKNNIIKNGELKLFGVPLDMKLIKTPLYMIPMQKDHLVPWKAMYDSINMFNTKIRFVLGGSGHVAGIVNPPSRKKYCYWVNDKLPKSADEWFETAKQIGGSWWEDWINWLKPFMGAMVPKREISSKFVIRDAPGEYVKKSRYR